MKLQRIALLGLGALIITLGAIARPKKADNWEARTARAKADYIFLEAQNAYNQQDYSLYGRLLQRALIPTAPTRASAPNSDSGR